MVFQSMKSTYMTVDPQNGVLHGHCGCCCLSMFCDACRVAGAFDDAFLRSVSLHLIEDCTSGFLLHLRKDPPSHHSLIPPATLSCFEWLRTSTPMDRLHPLTRVSSTWPNLCSLPSAVELYPVRAVKRMMMNSERCLGELRGALGMKAEAFYLRCTLFPGLFLDMISCILGPTFTFNL